MHLFRRPDYTSEATRFLSDLKAKKPLLEAQQLAGRALLWDKKIDRSAATAYQDAGVAQQAYVYQTSNHPNST